MQLYPTSKVFFFDGYFNSKNLNYLLNNSYQHVLRANFYDKICHLQILESSYNFIVYSIILNPESIPCIAGADPGFDQGGTPDCDRPKLATVRSSIVQAKRALFSMGSGACLRAPEALGYFITKYAFSPFRGTFLYYFLK